MYQSLPLAHQKASSQTVFCPSLQDELLYQLKTSSKNIAKNTCIITVAEAWEYWALQVAQCHTYWSVFWDAIPGRQGVGSSGTWVLDTGQQVNREVSFPETETQKKRKNAK